MFVLPKEPTEGDPCVYLDVYWVESLKVVALRKRPQHAAVSKNMRDGRPTQSPTTPVCR